MQFDRILFLEPAVPRFPLDSLEVPPLSFTLIGIVMLKRITEPGPVVFEFWGP